MPKESATQRFMSRVMHAFEQRERERGAAGKVRDPKQAVAVAHRRARTGTISRAPRSGRAPHVENSTNVPARRTSPAARA